MTIGGNGAEAGVQATITTLPPDQIDCISFPPMSSHTYTRLGFMFKDQIVFCRDSTSVDCTTYDPCLDSWETIPNMLDQMRSACTAIPMHDGSIWFIGGEDDSGQVLNTTVQRLFDGTFVPGPDIIHAGSLQYACGFQINETHIFIAGGRSNDPPSTHLRSAVILDIVSHAWTNAPDMTHQRYALFRILELSCHASQTEIM